VSCQQKYGIFCISPEALLLGQNSSLSEQMLPASAVGSYGAADLLGYIQTQVATGQRFGAANGAVAQEIFNFYANSSAGEEQPAGSSAFYIYQYTQASQIFG
jgi:hypothetical protein